MPPSNPKYTVPVKLQLVSARLMAEFTRLVGETERFAQAVGDTLRGDPKGARTFIERTVPATGILFQKWNLEILYLLALVSPLRFGHLKDYLEGISSRTLSLKLADMEKRGLVHREVFAERPLRVEYSLTVDGRTAARLTVPLVMFLNQKLGLRLDPEESP